MWTSHSPSAFSASDVSLEDDLTTSPSLHASVNSSPEQYTDHTFTHTIAYWSPDPVMEETLQPVCPVTIESFQLSGRLHNSDGTPPPPPRKRRRPALSCEQCRKRKIKCDRNYPCTQCLQSKTAACSYSADSPVRATGHVSNSTGLSSIQNGISMPNRAINAPSALPSTKLSSDGTSPTAVASSGSTQISSWGSPTAEAHMDETSNPKALVDRVRKLESIFLAENGNRSMESNIFSPKLESSKELRLRGTYSKTRFFGQSHWMYSFGMFDKIAGLAVNPKNNTPDFKADVVTSDIIELLDKCKSIARAAKAIPHTEWLTNPNFRESVPPRAVADKLVNLYFRTSESKYRILHIPSFKRDYAQYWEQPLSTSPIFILQLLLVMSIGAIFYQDSDAEFYRTQAVKWIFAAQAWLSSPFEKGRLHISCLQVYCLLLIAREENSVAGDLVWISGGSLIRAAFQMGFHRDPKYLPDMPPLEAELRRRLWATVVEIDVQSALDSGMPSLLSVDDWDTEPPANVDDIDLNESTSSIVSKPPHVFTQTSLQLSLLKSIRSRLEVIRLANNFRTEPSYDEILALDASLTNACKETTSFINNINASFPPNSQPISQFHRNIIDCSVRRFILILHRPFAAKARTDPRYYFSRKVCLDSSLIMLTYPSSPPNSPPPEPGIDDDYTRLKFGGGGFFKGLIVHGNMTLFAELLSQVEEGSPNLHREPLKAVFRDVIDLAAKRIALVENNVKGHLFSTIVLAQIEALEQGVDPEQAVLKAARESASLCLELLRKRVERLPGGLEGSRGLKLMGSGGVDDGMSVQNPALGVDFTMQDWTMDFDSPESFLVSGWEDTNSW